MRYSGQLPGRIGVQELLQSAIKCGIVRYSAIPVQFVTGFYINRKRCNRVNIFECRHDVASLYSSWSASFIAT